MAATLLDPHETNAPLAEEATPWGSQVATTDPEVTFRHSGWHRTRSRVRRALVATGIRSRPLARFDLCGSDPWVAVNTADPEAFCILTNTCHSRWCRPCANAKAHIIETNLLSRLSANPHRLITLTLRHRAEPLKLQLNRLYACFRRLRNTPFWKHHVTGGAAILEVGHSTNGLLWHPHLHIVCEGKYVPSGQLSDHWRDITGDSFIVDVRYIRTAPQITGYLAKYLRKPIASTIINKPPLLEELIRALAHRRLCTTFGTWRLWPLTKSDDATVWNSLAPLSVIFERARNGDDVAVHQLTALFAKYPAYMTTYTATLDQQERPP
ncbi:hypothetical protein ES703_60843 [subsurface metagenome]